MTTGARNGGGHEPQAAPTLTGMAEAVLSEVASLLEAFARTGAQAAVDLTSIPLTRQDREELERRLGRGEVQASLDAAGRSEIWETAYAGVWWVRHFGEGERIATEALEIARVPAILMSHPEDMAAAAARLLSDLSEPAADVAPARAGEAERGAVQSPDA